MIYDFFICYLSFCTIISAEEQRCSIMEKYIPYEKLSKKEKRKIDQARRQTRNSLNPATRKPTNSKAYNRKKSQVWKRELPPSPVIFLDISDLFPYNLIRIWYCHRVVSESACLHIVRS